MSRRNSPVSPFSPTTAHAMQEDDDDEIIDAKEAEEGQIVTSSSSSAPVAPPPQPTPHATLLTAMIPYLPYPQDPSRQERFLKFSIDFLKKRFEDDSQRIQDVKRTILSTADLAFRWIETRRINALKVMSAYRLNVLNVTDHFGPKKLLLDSFVPPVDYRVMRDYFLLSSEGIGSSSSGTIVFDGPFHPTSENEDLKWTHDDSKFTFEASIAAVRHHFQVNRHPQKGFVFISVPVTSSPSSSSSSRSRQSRNN